MTRRDNTMRMLRGALVGTAIAGGYALLCWLLLAGRVFAHEAPPTPARPQAWSYPFSCCSGYDCREVPKTAIGERPEGYVIAATGEVVGYADSRLKDSPDGEFHWCSKGGAADGATVCLFVPPRGF